MAKKTEVSESEKVEMNKACLTSMVQDLRRMEIECVKGSREYLENRRLQGFLNYALGEYSKLMAAR